MALANWEIKMKLLNAIPCFQAGKEFPIAECWMMCLSENGFYVNRISTLPCLTFSVSLKYCGSELSNVFLCSFGFSCARKQLDCAHECVTANGRHNYGPQRRLRRQPMLVVTSDSIHSNGNSNWRWTDNWIVRDNGETRKKALKKSEIKMSKQISHMTAFENFWNDFDEKMLLQLGPLWCHILMCISDSLP